MKSLKKLHKDVRCEKEMELETRILTAKTTEREPERKNKEPAETKIDEMERKRGEMVWERATD
jgi:hypothetical protein